MGALLKVLRAGTLVAGGFRPAVVAALYLYRTTGTTGLRLAFANLRNHSIPRREPSRRISKLAPGNGQVEKVSKYMDWLDPFVSEAIAIDRRVASVPLGWRGPLPVLIPRRMVVGESLKKFFDVVGGLAPKTVIWAHNSAIGGSNTFALKIALEHARLFPQESVLILETSEEDEFSLRAVAPNAYIANPQPRRWGVPQSEMLKFYFELATNLGAANHLNVSSEICWDLFEVYGQAIRKRAKLGGMFFCADYDALGLDRGYSAAYFASLSEELDFILTDNFAHVEELISHFGLGESLNKKITHIFYPVENSSGRDYEPPNDDERLRVIWAGRFTEQKGVRELAKVASHLPEMDFHIFGGTKREFPVSDLSNNIKFHGKFTSFDALTALRPHIFLNTSHWEGRPITMLEVLLRQIPIVSSSSGGLAEMLQREDSTACVVFDSHNVEEYVKNLSFLDSDRSILRSLKLKTNASVLAEHSPGIFAQRVYETFC